MNEQMQQAQEKKKEQKFYQKWWFWLIVAICAVVIISVNSGDESSENTEKNTSQNISTNIATEAPTKNAQISEADYKASCNSYSYEELARNPEAYKNKNIVLKGEVVQVIENGKKLELRIYMDGVFDDTIYVTYTLKNGEERILEDDILNIYGSFEGLLTYETVLGANVTVPYVDAKYIERIS